MDSQPDSHKDKDDGETERARHSNRQTETERDGERGETETKTDSWWLGGRCGLRARETDRQTDIPNVLKFGTCNIAFD